MRRLRVLYCESNTDGTVGGSFYSLLYLIEGLDRLCYEPVVVFFADHPLVPRFRQARAEVHLFERPASTNLVALPIVRSSRILKTVASVVQGAVNFIRRFVFTSIRYARFLRRQRIDLLHLNNSITRNADWMAAALLTRTHCITHERGINDDYSWLSRTLGTRLDAIICISGRVRDTLVRHGIPDRNLVVLHNGLDPEAIVPSRPIDELRRAFSIGDRQPVIGMVSNLKGWKGQDVLIRALPIIRSIHLNVLCLFVGDTSAADRAYEAKLRALVEALDLSDHVRFLGFQTTVADALVLLDVSILTSIEEPFGRVLLEAMALHKPIVATRSGAIPEIVSDGVTGYLFDPGDVKALAGRTIELLNDPASARSMGLAGYRRLVEHFHIRQNVSRTQDLYSRVLAPATTRDVAEQPQRPK